MDLRQLEAFVSVATLRSFRAAANRLNITQPAVSLRISSLEDELGVRLFERANGLVRPTGKGLELLAYAEQVLDRVHRLKGAAIDSGPVQRVRLGVTSTIVHAWLSALTRLLAEALPHLSMELVVETTPRLRALLVAGELDAAIIMGEVHEPGLRSLPVGAYRTAWVASPEIAEALGPGPLSIDRVAAYPIISHARDSATFTSLEEAFRLNGLWSARLSSSNSVEAILQIARDGLAIGVLSEACVAPGDASLRVLDCELELPTYEFFASYHVDTVGRVGMIVAELAKQASAAARRNSGGQ